MSGDHAGPHEWTFPARVERVVDGDTLDTYVDLGFRAYATARVRLRGVDTAEVYGPNAAEEREQGEEHGRFTREWCAAPGGEWPLVLVTEKETGKYGRWVGDLFDPERDEWLTDALVAEFPEVADA